MSKVKRYHDDLANIVGCIVCRNQGRTNYYVSIHHIRGRTGGGEMNVLPLCGKHHQTGGEGVAIHPFKRLWESLYGTQGVLQYQCNQLIKEELGRDI